MIKGTGIDLIEIHRIEKAFQRSGKFFSRIYTEAERKYIHSRGMKFHTMAGYFASKEAVSKALGTGFREFAFQDIEILKDEFNKPRVKLHGNAKVIAGNLGVKRIHLSISHSKDLAIAYVVMES